MKTQTRKTKVKKTLPRGARRAKNVSWPRTLCEKTVEDKITTRNVRCENKNVSEINYENVKWENES